MREYSEKELVIFNGVFKLAQQGINLSDITARQIAEAAGIGKATIYDYFSSKEEILVQALVYAMEKQIEATDSRLASIDTFKGKMMFIYGDIINKVENSLSVFAFLTSMGGTEKLRSYFQQTGHCRMISGIGAGIENTLRSVISYGRAQGDITVTDRDYTYMTVTANIFTVGKARTDRKIPREKICENAYTMLLKALN